MKKSFLFLIILAVIISQYISSCKSSNVNSTTMVQSVDTPYSARSVVAAYDNFNRFLFDTTTKLYYTNTSKAGFGAIWTQAIYWDMAMNAYKLTSDNKYKKLMDDIFQGGAKKYDNYNWHNAKEWFIYDDIMWWVISLARAYDLTKDTKYLTLSEAGFKRVWVGSPVVHDRGSYDSVRGGMYWQWNQRNPPDNSDNGKMACINYPTVIAALTLYKATQKIDYLNKANEIYNWSRNNLFDIERGRVADSRHGAGVDWKVHTYNQATCIGAAVMLYKETGNAKYLNDAVAAANFTKKHMCDANGILPYEGGEEQGVYTAIFAQYIARLIEDGNKPEYLPWLRKNINHAWSLRDSNTNLMGKNYNAAPVFPASCYDASGIPALMLLTPVQ